MKILDRLTELDSGGTNKPWSKGYIYAALRAAAKNDLPHHYDCEFNHEKINEDDDELIAESRNALPALIEVARAAKLVSDHGSDESICNLDDALAKLEALDES